MLFARLNPLFSRVSPTIAFRTIFSNTFRRQLQSTCGLLTVSQVRSCGDRPGYPKNSICWRHSMRHLPPRVLYLSLFAFICLLFATSAFGQAPDPQATPTPAAPAPDPAGTATDDQ